jgi:hypothetical protein
MKTATRYGYEPTEVASDAIRKKEYERERLERRRRGDHDYDDEEFTDRYGRRVIIRDRDGGSRRRRRRSSTSTPPHSMN